MCDIELYVFDKISHQIIFASNYLTFNPSPMLKIFVSGAVNTETYSNMMYNIENLRNAPRNPFFHSQSQHFKIKIGADVTFPCYVNNKGELFHLNYESQRYTMYF